MCPTTTKCYYFLLGTYTTGRDFALPLRVGRVVTLAAPACSWSPVRVPFLTFVPRGAARSSASRCARSPSVWWLSCSLVYRHNTGEADYSASVIGGESHVIVGGHGNGRWVATNY